MRRITLLIGAGLIAMATPLAIAMVVVACRRLQLGIIIPAERLDRAGERLGGPPS